MKTGRILSYALVLIIFSSCIGEDIISDFVEAELRIENPLETLGINESYQFQIKYFNNVGQEENVEVQWNSSDSNIISVDSQSGFATALQPGSAILTATTVTSPPVNISTLIEVSNQTVEDDGGKSGIIESTSSYTLRGDFTIEENTSGELVLALADNYKASASLPGLYVYLTNNPNSIDGAFEIAAVQVYEGAHSYTLPADVELNDYEYLLYWCKPFSTKVGGGTID